MNQTPSRAVGITLAIVCVLVVLGIVYVLLGDSIRSWFSFAVAPAEVRQLQYLGVENDIGILYTLNGTSLEKRVLNGFSIVDYVHRGDQEVAILKTEKGAYDLYSISGDTPVQLTFDGREKNYFDLSPDGGKVVYGVKARNLPPIEGAEDEITYRLIEWDVEMLDIATKKVALVGPGNHPRFFKDGLFYPAPTGFVYRVIDENGFDDNDKASILPDVMAYRVLRIAVLDPDGFLAIPSVVIPAFETLTIDSVEPLRLRAAPENPIKVPPGTRDMYVTQEGTMLMLTPTVEGVMTLAELRDGEMHTLYTFSRNDHPERFISTN